MIKHLPAFRLWLAHKNYSESTIRNYLADINRYLRSYPDLTTASITAYLQTNSTDSNLSRYLSSLNKFCQFAYSQNLITQNPLKKTTSISIDTLINDFQTDLSQHHCSVSTLRNYINDLHQYINWLETSIESQ